MLDWNQIEQAKSLGEGLIDLAVIEPFCAVEIPVRLSSGKPGARGEIRVRLVFQPEIIAKSRKNTSTFSAAGRAMTQIGSAPLGAGKGVMHGVGNVGKLGKGMFGRQPKTIEEANDMGMTEPVVAQTPVAPPSRALPTAPAPAVPRAVDTAIAHTAIVEEPAQPQTPSGGIMKVTIVGAKDVPLGGESSVKPYVLLRAGKDEFKTKHSGKTQAPQW